MVLALPYLPRAGPRPEPANQLSPGWCSPLGDLTTNMAMDIRRGRWTSVMVDGHPSWSMDIRRGRWTSVMVEGHPSWSVRQARDG